MASSSGSAGRYWRCGRPGRPGNRPPPEPAPRLGISSPFNPAGYPCHPIVRDANARSAQPDTGMPRAPKFPIPLADGLHLLEFFRRKPSGLINDVFRDGQLADVVEQRRRAAKASISPMRDRVLSRCQSRRSSLAEDAYASCGLSLRSPAPELRSFASAASDIFHVALLRFDVVSFSASRSVR